ncbi:MAG: FHA domain-containing protein [Cryobacterium sp.]|nr:FHA domain-containing protein [Oligoflexia bacterium]
MSEKSSSKRIKLMVEGGPTREFSGGRTFVIGRSQNADFSIPHPNLSREHVRMSLKDGEVWMEDLGSANGTFVQGQKIPPNSVVKIKPHYRVLLGTGSNVVMSFAVVEDHGTLADASPKGDADLLAASAPKAPVTQVDREATRAPAAPIVNREATRTSVTRSKMELDFPKEHFPVEAKKEKAAELRIIEAKKQRVIEDIQYKEREVDDLRAKIRELREESVKLNETIEVCRRETQPLADRKADLENRVAELDVIYEEKIDTLESGFKDLKQTLEESHAVRMARADREFKEKVRTQDEYYANQLNQLDNETQAVREEGERIRDALTLEKKEYEEKLKKVRNDAEVLEADRRLTQVRVDTEIAQLQGTKMKLENELESLKREKDKFAVETQATIDIGRTERARLDEVRREVEFAAADRDRFQRDLENLKLSEAKDIERVEALKAEVIRLETRSQGIENALEKARLDADSIRLTARQEADAIHQAAREQIEAERVAVRKNVESEVQARILAVESQVVLRVQTIDAEVAAKRAAVDAGVLAVSEQAQASVKVLNENAERVASEKIDAAARLANATLEAAQIESSHLVETARVESARISESALASAQTAAAKLEADANAYYESKRIAAEALVSGTQGQADARRRTAESELMEMRKRTEVEMRQVRANALADIEAAKDREMKEVAARLKGRIKDISSQLERILGSKLAGQYGVTMDAVSVKSFGEEIHQVVANVIGPSKSSGNTSVENTLGSVLPVNTDAQERAVLYWKKVGIAATVLIALGLGKVLAPDFYTMVGHRVAGILEVKDNTDLVVKRLIRERQLAMTFVTELDQHYRENYTDNVLYTEGFIEMKDENESQKVWTLALNKFFQGELGLTEKAIVQFGSAEGRMIRELIDLRKNIIPVQSEAGIQKMRETEASFVKEMKFIVRTDANWQRFQTFHRDFYTKYTQTFLNRAPADAASTP